MNLFDPGLFTAWCALWLALAVLVRRGAARAFAGVTALAAIYDWNFRHAVSRAYHRFEKHGWSGRHGLPDALARAIQARRMSMFELEQVHERPPVEDVGMHGELSAKDERQVAEILKGISTDTGAPAADAAPTTSDTAAPADPAWAQLMADFEASWDALAADVDAQFDAMMADLFGEQPVVRPFRLPRQRVGAGARS